jgi:hypothetical protein
VTAHLQRHHRNSQHQADPETARHIDEFWIGTDVRRCDDGLEGHAADRAIAGAGLPDLRMHRAGVDRSRRSLLRDRGLSSQILRRLRHELVQAAGRAEVVRTALVAVSMSRGVGIDGHAADGILHAIAGLCSPGLSVAGMVVFGGVHCVPLAVSRIMSRSP